jgi:hypothetical protein
MRWRPGTHTALQASEDKMLRVWDVRTLEPVAVFPADQYFHVRFALLCKNEWQPLCLKEGGSCACVCVCVCLSVCVRVSVCVCVCMYFMLPIHAVRLVAMSAAMATRSSQGQTASAAKDAMHR